MKASWGISTAPTTFILFFPSRCFSRSLRLRGDVAAVALRRHVLAQALIVVRAMIWPPMAPWIAISNMLPRDRLLELALAVS